MSDDRIAELEGENSLLTDALANYEQDNARLRGLCMWAAGRLLDAGDVQGHEHMLRKIGPQ